MDSEGTHHLRSRYLRCMRSLVVVFVFLLSSCGGSPPASQTSERKRREAEEYSAQLDEVQLECRSSQMIDIGKLDAIFGPSCDSPTLEFALKSFDIGVLDGELEAMEWSTVQTFLCICKDGPCSEENANRIIAKARKVFVEDAGKRERNGVLNITNTLQSHSCLNAVIGAEIYKQGFNCGFLTGRRSQSNIRDQIDAFMKVENLDEPTARRRALDCMDAETERDP